MNFIPLLAEASSGENIFVLFIALIIGGVILAIIAMIPFIGPFLVIALVISAAQSTCDRRHGCTNIDKKDNMTYVVQLHEMNPNIDRVLQHPEAEIRITR